MANFADSAFLLAMIVFVFAVFPSLLAELRSRRARTMLVALTVDVSSPAEPSWPRDREEH